MNALTGTSTLTRLALRRDRITAPAWVLGLAAFTAATTALWADDFRDPATLLAETRITVVSPGIRILGLASGASVGSYAMVRNFVLLAVLAALMSTFSVVRHTRQSEETCRAELVGAPSGLGYAIEYYRSMLATPSVMAFIAVIGLLGFLSDRALRLLGSALTPWARTVAAP